MLLNEAERFAKDCKKTMPPPAQARGMGIILLKINVRMATATRKRKPARTKKQAGNSKKDLSASFNKFKNFNGKLYTGVQIGRGHHWNYDKGDWKETKITPDLWEISYAVTK